MRKTHYFVKKDFLASKTHINVIDLIKNSKLEEKREKRQKFLVVTIAASALALSGYIISQ
jgi:hypothetical protein